MQTTQGQGQPATNGQQQPQNLAVARMEKMKAVIAMPSVQEQFSNALGADQRDSFVASLTDLFAADSYLQECEPKLVIMEALKAALLKLPVNKSLGFAYIVAYKGKPAFQMGYKGYVQLALRTSMYKYINTDIVYEGELRTKNKLTGEYDLNGNRTGDTKIGYFAHFELNSGFAKTLYMTFDQVHAHAKTYSPQYGKPGGIWDKEFDKMAMKTVLRGLLSHWGYLSADLQKAFEAEESDDVAGQVEAEISSKANVKTANFQHVEEIQSTPADAYGMGDSSTQEPGF